MAKVFIDDIRTAPEGYMCFRTAEEFMEYLSEHPDMKIDVLHLDHDLGLGVMDGYDIVKELYRIHSQVCINEVRLHTDNHVGFDNMYYYLVSAIKNEALPNVKSVSPYVYDCRDTGMIRGLKVH